MCARIKSAYQSHLFLFECVPKFERLHVGGGPPEQTGATNGPYDAWNENIPLFVYSGSVPSTYGQGHFLCNLEAVISVEEVHRRDVRLLLVRVGNCVQGWCAKSGRNAVGRNAWADVLARGIRDVENSNLATRSPGRDLALVTVCRGGVRSQGAMQ
jgi:rhodanese-related sulfurtransferase